MKKNLLWRKLSISKMIRVYAQSSKEACELVPRIEQGLYPGLVGRFLWRYHFFTFLWNGRWNSVKKLWVGYFNKCTGDSKPNYFPNKPWIFQQDSAPAHKTKTAQQFLENHVPEFLVVTIGCQPAQTLIPLNYKLWSVLEGIVCKDVTIIWSHWSKCW